MNISLSLPSVNPPPTTTKALVEQYKKQASVSKGSRDLALEEARGGREEGEAFNQRSKGE